MSELCTDNRFELIEKYKQKLIDGTNIETAQDEMAVIDNILFRFWQMGWLDKLDADAVPVVRCKDCRHYWKNGGDNSKGLVCLASPKDDAFCSEGERKKDPT